MLSRIQGIARAINVDGYVHHQTISIDLEMTLLEITLLEITLLKKMPHPRLPRAGRIAKPSGNSQCRRVVRYERLNEL